MCCIDRCQAVFGMQTVQYSKYDLFNDNVGQACVAEWHLCNIVIAVKDDYDNSAGDPEMLSITNDNVKNDFTIPTYRGIV